MIDFTLDMARAWIILADRLEGNAEIDGDGRLTIRLQPADDATAIAATITNDDFPFAYVIPLDDSTLIVGA